MYWLSRFHILFQKSVSNAVKKSPFLGGWRFFWSKFGKVRTSVFLQSFRLSNYVKFIFISCLQLLQKSKMKVECGKKKAQEVGTRLFWLKFGKVRTSVFLQSFRLYNYVKFIFISCLQLLQKSKSKWVLNVVKKGAFFREVGTRFFWSKFGKVRTSVFLQLFRLYNYVKFIFISCLQLLQKSKSKWVVNVVKKGPFEGTLELGFFGRNLEK